MCIQTWGSGSKVITFLILDTGKCQEAQYNCAHTLKRTLQQWKCRVPLGVLGIEVHIYNVSIAFYVVCFPARASMTQSSPPLLTLHL